MMGIFENWMNVRAEQMTLRMLEFLCENLSIDSGRIYVMGVSMGGGGSLTFAMHHADRVAKVCDIMGMTDFIQFAEENAGRYRGSIRDAFGGLAGEIPAVYRDRSAVCHVDRLKNIPILILHGRADAVVPIRYSKLLYDKLRSANGQVEFIPVADVGHDNKIIIGLEDKVLTFFS